MIDSRLIEAENIDPALTDTQQLALQLLVRSYKPYREQGGLRWPLFEQKLAAEVANPTVVTRGLKAVLTALKAVPKIVVESNGSDKQQSFYSTKLNWDELALDALDIMFPVNQSGGTYNTILVVHRNVVLNNRTLMPSAAVFFVGD